jgi:5'(3')-deoxyribonucleotidase
MRDKVCLFDLDGTLADYDGQLIKDLNKIRSPFEPEVTNVHFDYNPSYIEARRHVITNQLGWFRNLPKFNLGFDILEQCGYIGYKVSILTKGPSSKYAAWSEKLQWVHEHVGKDEIDGVTICHDKGLIYGNVLVDDYPEYIAAWLKYRPRGLVIMPAHDFNKDFNHPHVVRYDGTNLNKVISVLETQYNR